MVVYILVCAFSFRRRLIEFFYFKRGLRLLVAVAVAAAVAEVEEPLLDEKHYLPTEEFPEYHVPLPSSFVGPVASACPYSACPQS
jgi:hypothetical protein